MSLRRFMCLFILSLSFCCFSSISSANTYCKGGVDPHDWFKDIENFANEAKNYAEQVYEILQDQTCGDSGVLQKLKDLQSCADFIKNPHAANQGVATCLKTSCEMME